MFHPLGSIFSVTRREWKKHKKMSRDIKGDLTKNKFSCAPALTRREWRLLPTPHSGRMDNLRSSKSKGMETAWLDRSCGKTACCCRRYISGGDMLLEGICYQRGYIKKVSSQRRYPAKKMKTFSLVEFSLAFVSLSI